MTWYPDHVIQAARDNFSLERNLERIRANNADLNYRALQDARASKNSPDGEYVPSWENGRVVLRPKWKS